MQVRHPTFDLAGSMPHWGDNAAACNVVNAGGIIPPPIERYLIKVLRRAKQELDPEADSDLIEAVTSFNQQEAQHFKLHAEYLAMLATKGYPRIGEHEAAFEAELDEFLATRDLAWNLGYSEGFESTGAAMASGWLDGPMAELCGDDGSEVMCLWRWHLAEEFEHRSVVHDVLLRLYGRERAHQLRSTVGEFARGHYGDHAGRAAAYLFAVDRASMTSAEVAASEAAEMDAWLTLGAIAGDGLAAIHDPDYDPATIPEPATYRAVLAQYA